MGHEFQPGRHPTRNTERLSAFSRTFVCRLKDVPPNNPAVTDWAYAEIVAGPATHVSLEALDYEGSWHLLGENNSGLLEDAESAPPDRPALVRTRHRPPAPELGSAHFTLPGAY